MEASAKRRIFVNVGNDRCQLFSFYQHKDGSIYCSSPDFADARWIGVSATEAGLKLEAAESTGDGKLSLHGTGMVAFRSHDEPDGHKVIVKGNLLKHEQELRVRHLFTVFPRRPYHLPVSPAFNRASDYSMQANEELKPFVLAFFAVPRMATEVDFRFSLSEEVMERVPEDFLGGHFFTLEYHHVFWFAYRTKSLTWPKYSHFCYSDGYLVPVFIGGPENRLNIQLRHPNYELSDDSKLIIDCSPIASVRSSL